MYEFPKYISKLLRRLTSTYIWGETTPDLVKKDIIQMHKTKGGLGLLDHDSQNIALRLRYIHQIVDPNIEKNGRTLRGTG